MHLALGNPLTMSLSLVNPLTMSLSLGTPFFLLKLCGGRPMRSFRLGQSLVVSGLS